MGNGIRMEKQIKLPSKWQFMIVVPFAALFMLFIIFGDLEKASELGAARNLGRIFLCMLICYGILLLLCFLIANRKAFASFLPEKIRLPEQRKRQGKWYVFLFFFLVCFFCYLPFF